MPWFIWLAGTVLAVWVLYQLSRALTLGQVRTWRAVYNRTAQPIRFWMQIGADVSYLFLFVCCSVEAVLRAVGVIPR